MDGTTWDKDNSMKSVEPVRLSREERLLATGLRATPCVDSGRLSQLVFQQSI